ncbi:MAG: TonB-dependent receptor [Prevotella sp.]|nr:TonB-dependent receptor [Prevotella sp.]
MNLQIKKASLALLLSLVCCVAFAQKTIKGSVKDAHGEPLIGVSIQIGEGVGAVTDIDGNFTIPNASAASTLKISYVGYKSQTVKVGNQTTFNITMQEDNANLDEVIVIGYGTVKKRDLTGSVASVNHDQLTTNPVSNVAEALQGKLAGVHVVSQDGRPGASVNIRVRGGGSISQSNDPLYIVDGFPVTDINDVPADQIVSIDVLKDASSTAIYGARGGNGVILVTTKSAQEGKISVSYNGYYQTQWAAKTLGVMNAQDYVAMTWAYAASPGSGGSADDMARYFGLGAKYGNHYADYANMASHDYTDDLLRTASAWNHNVSVSGGSEKTQFTFSTNYNNDEGIKVNSNFERFAMDLKLRQQIAKRLFLDMDLRYSDMNTRGREATTSSKGSVLSSAFEYRPIDKPLGEDDFTLFGMGAGNIDPSQNPYAITETLYNLTQRNRLRGNFALSWEPVKGLTGRAEYGMGRSWGQSKYYDDGSINSAFTRGHKYATLSKDNGKNWRFLGTINYEVQGLGDKHQLSFLVGNEEIKRSSETLSVYGGGYPMGEEWTMERVFGLMHMGDAAAYPAENYYKNDIDVPTTTQSWFGRVNYSYLGRYLLTATFRADGSSKFGPNHRWGYFPAAALAWRVSDEPFMKSTSHWLDNLKLRLSYGEAGNDNISSSLWHETWAAGTGVWDEKNVQTFAPSGLKENPDLKWETTISRNIGIDFGFFNRINGTLDFYWNTTKDLLMNQEIDSSTGYTNQYANIGQTSNKGVELAINAALVRSKNFNLNLNATYNLNFNNVDELADHRDILYGSGWGSSALMPALDYMLTEGRPVGLVRGYTSDGFYTTADFNYADGVYTLKEGVPDISASVFTAYPKPSTIKTASGQNAFPGALKLKDLTQDGTVDSEDVSVIGEIQPHHTGGFGFSGNWKSLDFTANFTYQIGGKVYNAAAMTQYTGGKEPGIGKNRRDFVSNYYKLYDIQNGELVALSDPAALDALNANATCPLPFYESSIVLSEFVEDASFLRLSNITVGYTLPRVWTQKLSIQSARVYVTGGNLFCLTGYSGLDPEVNTDITRNTNYPTLGMDYGAYQRARTFTVGLNIKF